MSIKVKQAILESLEKIRNDDFDEGTIRTLLISSREYLSTDSLLRELAHFIAHPERSQGAFYRKINSRYTKFKLIQGQFEKFGLEHMRKYCRTNDELSDFLLGAVNVNKIEAKLFSILYKDGLDDVPESHLLKYANHTKKGAATIINESYFKQGGYYYLKILRTEKMIADLESLGVGETERLEMENAKKTAAQFREAMDTLQQVIRGVIYFPSVFDIQGLLVEFHDSFKKVLDRFQIESDYLNSIEISIQAILVCIMTLLHDSKFICYGNDVARVSLCSYIEPGKFVNSDENDTMEDHIYANGVLALYVASGPRGSNILSFPLVVSDVPIKDFVEWDVFKKGGIKESMQELPWITAARADNKLKLI